MVLRHQADVAGIGVAVAVAVAAAFAVAAAAVVVALALAIVVALAPEADHPDPGDCIRIDSIGFGYEIRTRCVF